MGVGKVSDIRLRKGGESSVPWHLGCTLEVFHMHSYQDQFIQPIGPSVFCVFSLGLCFVC